ncbi:MAG TPA: alpha-glucuronidase family glycosyl hydrolase, partial [Acidobacteriaceae bacterium]|nr:alpha-glucuronidase family glycosyl hydrolase [Acidobacteriaceae bacterium]
MLRGWILGISCALSLSLALHAETGAEGWLRYASLTESAASAYRGVPLQASSITHAARSERAAAELQKGLSSMLGASGDGVGESRWLLGSAKDLKAAAGWKSPNKLGEECFSVARGKGNNWLIAGGTDRGELYGVFYVLEQIGEQKPLQETTQCPSAPIRWVNQWD